MKVRFHTAPKLGCDIVQVYQVDEIGQIRSQEVVLQIKIEVKGNAF